MSTALSVPHVKLELNKQIKAISNLVGEENKMRFISSCITCFEKVPALVDCHPKSLINAFMEGASLGLFPNNSIGECYILPYKTKSGTMAQFQIGYKGFVTLFYRSGVTKIDSQIVFRNDAFEYELGLDPKLRHRPADGDRGLPTHAYAIAKMDTGETIFRVMKEEEIMKIKATSKAKDSKFSPWNSNDPEYWMWQKTVIKQLAKLLPKTERIAKAVNIDNICERGGFIGTEENEIIEASFEKSPDEKIEDTNSKRDELRKKKAEAPLSEEEEKAAHDKAIQDSMDNDNN